jgi:hypothetical protein
VQLSAFMTASSFGSFLRGPAFAMVCLIGGEGGRTPIEAAASAS